MGAALKINRDDRTDSYCQGWDVFFQGGCSYTNDTEIDADLYKEGWEAAKLEADCEAYENRFEVGDALERRTYR